MITLENVCFAYSGITALRFISFHVEKGESLILTGPNGCGKSTLIKLLNGIYFAQEGEYHFGTDLITEKALKNNTFVKQFHQKIGYVFQNPDSQLFCASVEEEIAFGPRQMGLSVEEIKVRTEDCIRLLGLENLRFRAPYHLSGGEKRKVSIACILSMNPEVLILDEPLAGLDEKTQQWLTEFLKQLNQAGKTLIISTHSSQLAKAVGTRFIEMNEYHEVVIPS